MPVLRSERLALAPAIVTAVRAPLTSARSDLPFTSNDRRAPFFSIYFKVVETVTTGSSLTVTFISLARTDTACTLAISSLGEA